MKVFDGYFMVEAKPAKENHELVIGSNYFKIPEDAYVWNVEHGATGWWSLKSQVGQPMRDTIYSVPKDSPMLSKYWETFKGSVREEFGAR